MNYVELSIEKLKEENKKLYDIIRKEYDFDCVVFIARGSYLIGEEIASFNNVKLLEIFATRKSASLIKKIASPMLKILPKSLKKFLRKSELKSGIHNKDSERVISYNKSKFNGDYKKILLVDDSIDTGNTICQVYDELRKIFPNSEIKTAVLNIFTAAKTKFTPDFSLYEDTVILGPWSNDSKEHTKYIHEYKKWHDNYEGDTNEK